MIVKIQPAGKSFAGLGAYLTHDVKAETEKRVAWTHTRNLAHDHVPSAVDEMLWTSRYAEILKQEAGVRAGGRATENSVKHLSLNWSPDERPDRAHMIETSDAFLRHMGWQDHQAVLVAHNDTAHAHVHLMLNVVHPDTGLRLDDGFERRRAQAWALDYEKSQGRIYCEQRLLDPEEREDAPTRPAWQSFDQRRREFMRMEQARENEAARQSELPDDPAARQAAEWKILKDMLQEERQAFMAEGKSAFSELRNSVYREVREEFRERWADFHEARKSGGIDPATLAEMKAALVDEQKLVLEERRDDACASLRESRDTAYRALLDEQRELRHGLHWRQEAGLETGQFLDAARECHERRVQTATFGEAAAALTTPSPDPSPRTPEAFTYHARASSDGIRSGGDIGAGIGLGLLSMFAHIVAGPSVDPAARTGERPPERERAPDWTQAATDAGQEVRQREQEQAEEEARRRQRDAARG